MAGILTRDTIISNGLELGGNPGLTTLAQAFLNLVLDRLYRKKDWPWLRKTTTALADATSFDKIPTANLPTDYRAILKLRPQSSLVAGWLKQNPDFEDLWLKRRLDIENSMPATQVPSEFAVDEGSNAGGVPDIYVYPKPDTRFTYDLLYYRIPAALSANVAPDFPDHSSLVYAIAEWCKDYERDNMQVAAQVYADRILSGFANNASDRGRSDQIQMPFDDNVWKTIRSD